MKNESQEKQILDYLKTGKSISPLEALNKFGCMRLASRICDLRRQGYNIETHMVYTSSWKKFAYYKLIMK